MGDINNTVCYFCILIQVKRKILSRTSFLARPSIVGSCNFSRSEAKKTFSGLCFFFFRQINIINR
jgi:hypothetical protein